MHLRHAMCLTYLFLGGSSLAFAVPLPLFNTPAVHEHLIIPSSAGERALTLSVSAGGDTAASELQLGENCRGYIEAKAATARVQFAQEGDTALTIQLESDDKVGLVINASDGKWYCAQSAHDQSARIVLKAPYSGQIDIWASNFQENDTSNATLHITMGE